MRITFSVVSLLVTTRDVASLSLQIPIDSADPESLAQSEQSWTGALGGAVNGFFGSQPQPQ